MESLLPSTEDFREQSLPPYVSKHTQEAVHVTSRIEQDERMFPEGSRYLQAPFPEHTDPVDQNKVELRNVR